MSLFKTYKTDKKLETKGISFTPDASTVIILARAGGSNVKFAKMLDKATKPHRRQIDNGTMDPKLDLALMAGVVARTLVLNWETLVGPEGKEQLVQGIEADPNAKDGTYSCAIDKNGLVPFNVQNVTATLIALPDLLQDIQKEAGAASNFLEEERAEDSKK